MWIRRRTFKSLCEMCLRFSWKSPLHLIDTNWLYQFMVLFYFLCNFFGRYSQIAGTLAIECILFELISNFLHFSNEFKVLRRHLCAQNLQFSSLVLRTRYTEIFNGVGSRPLKYEEMVVNGIHVQWLSRNFYLLKILSMTSRISCRFICQMQIYDRVKSIVID